MERLSRCGPQERFAGLLVHSHLRFGGACTGDGCHVLPRAWPPAFSLSLAFWSCASPGGIVPVTVTHSKTAEDCRQFRIPFPSPFSYRAPLKRSSNNRNPTAPMPSIRGSTVSAPVRFTLASRIRQNADCDILAYN